MYYNTITEEYYCKYCDKGFDNLLSNQNGICYGRPRPSDDTGPLGDPADKPLIEDPIEKPLD